MMLKMFVQDQEASQSPGQSTPGQWGYHGATVSWGRDPGPKWQMWQPQQGEVSAHGQQSLHTLPVRRFNSPKVLN